MQFGKPLQLTGIDPPRPLPALWRDVRVDMIQKIAKTAIVCVLSNCPFVTGPRHSITRGRVRQIKRGFASKIVEPIESVDLLTHTKVFG